MAKLTFNQVEIDEMKRVSSVGHKEWDKIKVKELKPKIKSHKREIQRNLCCYCHRDITNESKMVLDIEHVIPKSKKIKHIFTLKNLGVSCRRCNFIKGTKVDFLSKPIQLLPKRLFRSEYYKFIHPNLDEYKRHLQRFSFQIDENRIVKYRCKGNSAKGQYTYQYFRLKEFEIESFNSAQGKKTNNVNDENIAAIFAMLSQ